ncbi:hypothetical protein [Bifidobacterium aesculapii]|uniref:hypothetical protein n=1 Tax=Bifidobacterium aesculapii TaxID=1329411 RepID=UPI0006E31FFF|nr:hypothetical protein [Bifidobacterium aesculapii]
MSIGEWLTHPRPSDPSWWTTWVTVPVPGWVLGLIALLVLAVVAWACVSQSDELKRKEEANRRYWDERDRLESAEREKRFGL